MQTARQARRRVGLEYLESRSMLAAGVLDTTFGTGGVAITPIGTGDADLFDMAIEPDGKIVAVGLVPGQGYAVARYNADGSLDTTFGTSGTEIIPSTGSAHRVAIQADGKIVIAGDTNGAPDQKVVVRLTDSGALDPTFGTGGKVTVGNGGGGALAIDSSGRIIVAGGGSGVTRLNSDGTLDTTFGTNGFAAVTVTSGNASGFDITRAELQPDGKIVLSGYGPYFVSNTYTSDIAVARLNANGTLDTSFGGGGTVTTSLRGSGEDSYAEAIEPGGKIVVGGSSYRPPNGDGYDLAMVRYNIDGSIDTTFGDGGKVIDSFGTGGSMIFDMLIEPNGKIVASGQANVGAALIRFNPDGTLDSTFGKGGIALAQGERQGQGQAIIQQPNGEYIMGGILGGATLTAPDAFALERFTGEAPPTTSGIANVNVAAGAPSQVIQLTHDFTGGSVPASQLSYSLIGDTNPALFSATTIDAQAGTLTLAFTPQQTGNALLTVRATDPDGTFADASFQVTVGAASTDDAFGTAGISTARFPGGDSRDYAVAVQSDGKVVEVGTFTQGTTSLLAVARFNVDGSLDTSFGNGGEVLTPISAGPNAPISVFGTSVVIQPDGRIIVGASADGFRDFLLARYQPNGQLDATFGTGGIARDAIGNERQIALQPDGKIVAVGGDANGFVVARYDADGSLDNAFGDNGVTKFGISPNGSALALAVAMASDNKVVAAGLTAEGGKQNVAVARLNANGTLDATFGSQGIVETPLRSGIDSAFTVAVGPDGKIVAAGSSQRGANDVYDAAFIRYNADGTLDTNFGSNGIDIQPISANGSSIIQAAVLPSGQIIGSGTLAASNGGSQLPFVCRLKVDGSLDTTFDGTGMASVSVGNGGQYAAALAIQPDGNYLQAAVAMFNGQTEFAAVRYLSGAPATVPVQITAATGVSFTEQAASSNQALATFEDPNGNLSLPSYQATINWGDGTSASTATVTGPDANGVFTVLGSHSYAEESASIPLTVTVLRNGANAASLQTSVQVADAPLSGSPLTLSATAGTAISGPMGSFTDANAAAAASDFTAIINWGDGTSASGTVSASGGAFIVGGSHVYSDAAPATAPITIVVNDGGGSSTTIDSQATVAQPSIIGAGATLTATQGAALSGVSVAAFTRGDGLEPASGFSASIDWGDGESSTGTVTESAGTYGVVGTHAYASSGSFTIDATVTVNGNSTSIAGSASIAPVPTPHQLYVESVYHDVLDRLPDPDGLAYWAAKLDAGAPVSSVAASIAHSDEYYANFVIKPDYLKYLGRAADDSGVTYWTGQMQGGMTDGQLAAQLVASDEFFKQAGGGNGAWIDAMYQSLLGRAADGGGQAYWTAKLAAGETRLQVAQRFTASVESEKAQINDDYLHYLGRKADPTGMSHWLSEFAAGGTNEDVIAAFTGSDEYYKEHSG